MSPPYTVSLAPGDGQFASDCFNLNFKSVENVTRLESTRFVTRLISNVPSPFGTEVPPGDKQVTEYIDDYLRTFAADRVSAINILSIQMAEAVERAEVYTHSER